LGISALCTWKWDQNQNVNLKAENKAVALKRLEEPYYSSQLAKLTVSAAPQ